MCCRLQLLSTLLLALGLHLTKGDASFDWPVADVHNPPPLPEQVSRCTRSFKSYLIVVAGTRHNASWLHTVGDHVEHLIYQQHDPDQPNYYVSDGHEVGAYLQFINDYYDCLPKVIAFVHGHEEEGWHSFNMKHTIKSLQWHRVPGYTDLNRKMGLWELPLKNRPKYPSSTPIATGADVYSGQFHPTQIIGGNAYDPDSTYTFLQREANVHAYDMFFGRAGLGAMPEKISFVCCSQFAVTRERIRFRSKHFWQQNLHYLKHNDIQASNLKSKAHMVGDIWTIYWPIIFGEPADYERKVADHELFLG